MCRKEFWSTSNLVPYQISVHIKFCPVLNFAQKKISYQTHYRPQGLKIKRPKICPSENYSRPKIDQLKVLTFFVTQKTIIAKIILCTPHTV